MCTRLVQRNGAPKYLSVLTFLGLVMGFGKLALAISIIGFAGSFASELLKSEISAQQARDSKKKKDDEATWKTRSNDLARNILENTKSALAESLERKFQIAQTQ